MRPLTSASDAVLDFYHQKISKTVAEIMLKDEAARHFWHERLAAYFEQKM
jgi:hypothetical protein